MNLGERIAFSRKKLKLSQNELGKRVGTSGDIIGRYERNEVKPSIEVASKVADCLNISLDYLVGKTDMQFDENIMARVLEIQALEKGVQDKIFDYIDLVIRDAKAKQAYSK